MNVVAKSTETEKVGSGAANSPNSSARLSSLPSELLFMIASWLEVTDVLNLAAALARPRPLEIFKIEH